jgi:hypothetical protein
MTMLRSTPSGRGGLTGSSPAAIRWVQSAKTFSAAFSPKRLKLLFMPGLSAIRAAQPCVLLSAISRVAWSPS